MRKIAGTEPEQAAHLPSRARNVSEETAATSCSTAEFTAIVAASNTVLRRTTASFNQAAPAAPLLQWPREVCGARRLARSLVAGCGSSAPPQITVGAARTYDLARFHPLGFSAGKPTQLSFRIDQPSGAR
jgi:hypothetical protein